MKGTRRSIRAYAIQSQRDWALAAGFHPREGHGSDSLFYGPDGKVLLCLEHKQRARFTWGEVEEAMLQAEAYCRGEQGKPLPAVGFTTKPGPGKKARRYLILRVEQWQEIVGRLVGLHDARGPAT